MKTKTTAKTSAKSTAKVPSKIPVPIQSASRKSKYSLAAISVFVVTSFGEIIFKKAFGLDFWEAVKTVLLENSPLTLAAAIISVRIYMAKIDEDNLPFEGILYAALLCVAGYCTQLLTGHDIFNQAYAHSHHTGLGAWDFLAKILYTAGYTIVGYIRFYGMTETIMTLVTGAAVPWAILHKFKEFSKKLDP
jgi:hypothetical protein